MAGGILVLASLAGCGPRPVAGPDGAAAGSVLAFVGDAESLRLVDLTGATEARTLLLGGGWKGAVRVGCTGLLALDRQLEDERRLSVLDTGSGQLYPADLRPIEELAMDPAILDALVEAVGEEEAFPQDRIAYGALRAGAGGRPVVEVLGDAPEETVLLALEPISLVGPVERALVEAPACGTGGGVRGVVRSPYGREILAGEQVSGWGGARAAVGEPGGPGGAGGGAAPLVGTTPASEEPPVTVELPEGGTVVLPNAAPADAVEVCTSPERRWIVVRVEQPGLNGFDAPYVVRVEDAAVFAVEGFDVGELTAVGVAVVDAGTVLFGGPAGWFLLGLEGEPVQASDFAPVVP